MADLSYPGVYIDEVSSGVRPLERASTSTAAFVGVTQMGPEGPTRVTNWTDFQRTYGQYIRGSLLPQSVFQYFNNGGRQCYIVRVTRSGAKNATVTLQSRHASLAPAITFSAKSAGTWGNYLYLQIEDGTSDPGNEFKVSVRRQEEVDLVPENFRDTRPLEEFDDLSCDPASPRFVTEVLKRQSALIDATVHVLSDFPGGFHLGDTNPTVRTGDNRAFKISLDGDGFQKVEYAAAADETTDDIHSVADRITYAVANLTPKKNSNREAYLRFTCEPVPQENPTRLQLTSGSNG